MLTGRCIRGTKDLGEEDERPKSLTTLSKPRITKTTSHLKFWSIICQSTPFMSLSTPQFLEPRNNSKVKYAWISSNVFTLCKIMTTSAGKIKSSHHTCSKNISEPSQQFQSVALAQSLLRTIPKERMRTCLKLWGKWKTSKMLGRRTRKYGMIKGREVL